MKHEIFNTREEALEEAADNQIPRYIDIGGWGYYKLIDRSEATKNEIFVHDHIKVIAVTD